MNAVSKQLLQLLVQEEREVPEVLEELKVLAELE